MRTSELIKESPSFSYGYFVLDFLEGLKFLAFRNPVDYPPMPECGLEKGHWLYRCRDFVWQGVETYFSHDRIVKINQDEVVDLFSDIDWEARKKVPIKKETRTPKEIVADLIIKYDFDLKEACMLACTDKDNPFLTEREVIDLLINKKKWKRIRTRNI